MTDRDFPAFAELMRAVADATHTTPPNKPGLMLAFRVLGEYSLEQVQSAVYAHLGSTEGRFFPTPSHIIQQIEGTQAERAEYAWRLFLKALDKYGYYDSVRFPEPAYHYAIEMLGGWPKVSADFSQLSDRETNFRRAEFVSLYQRGERVAAFEPTDGKETVSYYLCGFFENDNRAKGHLDAIPPVVDVMTGGKIAQHELRALASGGDKQTVKSAMNGIVAQLGALKKAS